MPKDNRSKKIRDLKRLLQLDSIPETTRNEKERALAALESEKQSSANSREVLKMTQKYKMVKFVEHQKAVRRLSKAKKSLSIIQQQQQSTESTESNGETSSKEVRKRRDQEMDKSSKEVRKRRDQEINKAIEEVKNREVDVRYIENFPVLEKYISLYKDCVGPAAETTLQRRREIWEKAEKGELRKSDDGHVGKKQRREEAQIEDEEVDDFFE